MAHQALKDARLSKDIVAALDEDPEVVDPGLPGPALARHMMNLDPPDHERLRRLVSRAFVPSRIAALEPSIEHIADELLDELEGSGPDSVVDLVAGFAYPLPFRVICELLGVPEGDRAGSARGVPHAVPTVERIAAPRGRRRIRHDRRVARAPCRDPSGASAGRSRRCARDRQ